MSFLWCVVFNTVWAQPAGNKHLLSPCSRCPMCLHITSTWLTTCSVWHRVQTPLFPHSSDCRSNLSTRTHSCWPAGSVEHFGLMSASTWEGLGSQQGGRGGETSASFRGVFHVFRMVRILFCRYLAGTLCHQDIITVLAITFFSCLNHVLWLFFYCLLSVVSLKYFHIPKRVAMTYHFASLKSSLLIFNYWHKIFGGFIVFIVSSKMEEGLCWSPSQTLMNQSSFIKYEITFAGTWRAWHIRSLF